jgi:K+/H+ antiporter YhaU regulatory subunit KhtT
MLVHVVPDNGVISNIKFEIRDRKGASAIYTHHVRISIREIEEDDPRRIALLISSAAVSLRA